MLRGGDGVRVNGEDKGRSEDEGAERGSKGGRERGVCNKLLIILLILFHLVVCVYVNLVTCQNITHGTHS